MSVKITGVSQSELAALDLVYPERFTPTTTTVKFWGDKEHVLAQLEVAKDRVHGLTSDPSTRLCSCVEAIASKVVKATS